METVIEKANVKVLSTRSRILLSVLSGLLLAFLFPKFNQFYLAWAALVPLLLVLYFGPSPWRAAGYGLVCGLVFFGVFFYWTGLFGLLAWSSMTVFSALVYVSFSVGASFVIRRLSFFLRVFLIPAWMVSVELLRSIGWWGFSWGSLGYSQQADPNAVLFAGIFGFYGLTYLVVFVNILLTESLVLRLKQETDPVLPSSSRPVYVLLGSAFLLYACLAGFRTSAISNRKDPGEVKVAVLQGNIPQHLKFVESNREMIKKVYLKMASEAAEAGSYLIVWPETSYPGYLQDDVDFSSKLQRITDEYSTYLIVGSFYYDEKTDRYFNAAYFFRPGKEVVRYTKVNIVPFGEYVPFRPLFGWIKALEPISTDISPASDIILFPAGDEKIGTGICFESSNSLLVGKMVARGARLLVFITNDAWFKKTAAPYQHLQTTAIRSVENRIYTIQAANTGISAVIAPDGKTERATGLDERRILYGFVRFSDHPAFYSRSGYLFSYLCLLVSIAFFLRISSLASSKKS